MLYRKNDTREKVYVFHIPEISSDCCEYLNNFMKDLKLESNWIALYEEQVYDKPIFKMRGLQTDRDINVDDYVVVNEKKELLVLSKIEFNNYYTIFSIFEDVDKKTLTKSDTGFLLWALGYILGSSKNMDEAHKKYIEENHDRVLPKIGDIHESK